MSESPVLFLQEAGKRFKGAWREIDKYRSDDKSPDWCFFIDKSF